MIDYVEIGPVPANEDCEQLGPDYDPCKAREECKRFISTIRHALGKEPFGAALCVCGHPHDFGTYYDVAVKFDDSYPEAVDYAFLVESDTPTEWEEA